MTAFHRILIPTDGSENANEAAAQGLELAKSMNAEVTVLSVVDTNSLTYAAQGLGYADIYSYLEKGAEAAVDQVYREGKKRGVAVKAVVARGVPANEIIDASKKYDLIVMGSLGRTGLAHLLLGSVAEKVVRFAACPVLVIRSKEEKKDR